MVRFADHWPAAMAVAGAVSSAASAASAGVALDGAERAHAARAMSVRVTPLAQPLELHDVGSALALGRSEGPVLAGPLSDGGPGWPAASAGVRSRVEFELPADQSGLRTVPTPGSTALAAGALLLLLGKRRR